MRYNRDGYDEGGYDQDGYNEDGNDEDGYDEDGYDEDGCNKDGCDKDGCDKDGCDEDNDDDESYDEDSHDEDSYHIADFDEDLDDSTLGFVSRNDRPEFLFRIMYNMPYATARLQAGPNTTFNPQHTLQPLGAGLPHTWRALDNHLSWVPTPTPYISFFDGWARMMGFRNWLEREGAEDITIWVLDAKEIPTLISAEDIAVDLNYENTHRHCGEYLVYGQTFHKLGGNVLAYFPANGPEISEFIYVTVYGVTIASLAPCRLPSQLAALWAYDNALHYLQQQILWHTGGRGNGKLIPLLSHIAVS